MKKLLIMLIVISSVASISCMQEKKNKKKHRGYSLHANTSSHHATSSLDAQELSDYAAEKQEALEEVVNRPKDVVAMVNNYNRSCNYLWWAPLLASAALAYGGHYVFHYFYGPHQLELA